MRLKMEKNKIKFLFFIYIISIVIIGIILYLLKTFKSNQSYYVGQNQDSETSVVQDSDSNESLLLSQDSESDVIKVNIKEDNLLSENQTEEIKTLKQYPKEEIIKEYKGYNVCAKLEIPSIGLETYVLQNYSEQALNISVTKFWGVNPNEIGNCCIAGHNFKNKNMFRNLKKLNIGDKFTISDNIIGKVEYQIFDIYTVFPKDTSCLEPVTIEEREVTLITCTSDSKKRIIIKAKEVI